MKKFLAVFAVIALVAFAAPAFAANPFMDVPAGHWAYDAVAQLAARGVVSGYPDGAFKGAQPATRYEVASVVARALAKVDAEKASKQDLEMLKKLVMEFKDELDALGVKVDKLDKRVAVLEDRLGGWKLSGSFTFDANFMDNGVYYTDNGADTEFHKEWFSLLFQKQIDETTSLYARLRGGQYTGGTGRGDLGSTLQRDPDDRSKYSLTNEFHFDRIYVDMKLPYDIDFRVGRWLQDFEGDMGLYWGYDANPIFGSYRMDGFRAHKAWGNFNGTAIVARNSKDTTWGGAEGDFMHYALDINFRPNEKFFIGATGYMWKGDNGIADLTDLDVNTYGVYAGFAFNPNVELKGIYYFQNLGDDIRGAALEDSPKAWKAVLDVKQDLLKFTSLWLQYEQIDNTFYGLNGQNNMDWGISPSITDNLPGNNTGTTSVWMVGAEQKWNDKWTTFLKYAQADYDTAGLDDAKNWTAGVTYQYTPAVAFQLVYDNIDFGDNNPGGFTSGDDHLIKFRTSVSF